MDGLSGRIDRPRPIAQEPKTPIPHGLSEKLGHRLGRFISSLPVLFTGLIGETLKKETAG